MGLNRGWRLPNRVKRAWDKGGLVKFTLKMLFTAVLVVALICGLAVFVEQSWFGPARLGRESQTRLDAVFAEHQWQGYAGTWHYDNRVRIVSSDVGDDEMRLLYPILHDIHWLKHIEFHTPSMTDEGLAEMKTEFPKCFFTNLAE